MKLLMSVTKLDNFCIDERDPPLKERHPDDLLDGDEMEVTMNAEELDGVERQYMTHSLSDRY